MHSLSNSSYLQPFESFEVTLILSDRVEVRMYISQFDDFAKIQACGRHYTLILLAIVNHEADSTIWMLLDCTHVESVWLRYR